MKGKTNAVEILRRRAKKDPKLQALYKSNTGRHWRFARPEKLRV